MAPALPDHAQAEKLRLAQLRERQRAAAPGGTHDRVIRVLYGALPAGVGAVLAAMIITPLFPRSEMSFLLDRNKVAITEDRLKVESAMYRGDDDRGRPFTLTAGSAVQHSASAPLVHMRDLVARLQLSDGPGEVASGIGSYDINSDKVFLTGPVQFQTSSGYRMVTSSVTVDLKHRLASGTGGVSGQTPTGSFSADRITADLSARTLALDGRAHLRMTQGKISIGH